METSDLRSKEQITRDMDRTRARACDLIDDTRYMFVERNPAVRAWRATRRTYGQVRDRIVAGGKAVASGARSTHRFIKTKPYQSLGIALGAGALIGFLSTGKRRSS